MHELGRIAAAAALLAACGDDTSGADGGADDGPDAAVIAADARESGWSPAPDVIGGAVQETAAVAVDGTIYVLGGFNAQVGIEDSVRAYDIATDSWSFGPALPAAVHHANAAVVDGRIFVLGYLSGLGFAAAGDVWSWDPATESEWTTGHAPMPAGTERGSSIAGVIDGVIYVAGGFRAGGAVADVSAYDPDGDAWDTNLPALPAPRDHGCGGVVDGALIVAGGRQGAIESISDMTFAYTPGGQWGDRAAMITGRGGTACGVVGGALVVVGGEGNPNDASGVFPQAESYAVDAWTSLDPMTTPRHGMGAAAWGPSLYVPGGATSDGFGAVATFEIYTP